MSLDSTSPDYRELFTSPEARAKALERISHTDPFWRHIQHTARVQGLSPHATLEIGLIVAATERQQALNKLTKAVAQAAFSRKLGFKVKLRTRHG